MALVKGRKMVAFESRIFSKLKDDSKQSEQSEHSEQSSSDNKYTSLKFDNDLSTLSNASHTSFSNESNIPLFAPKKAKEQKGGLLGMLLGTLGASLLGNMLTGKGVNRAANEIIRAGYGATDF